MLQPDFFVVLLPVFPVVLAAPQVQDELPQTPYDVRRNHVFQFTGHVVGDVRFQLEDMLEQGGAVGRKLDFLIQEFNREANTIGSKASDVAIAGKVIDIKAEVEKIREQIQNIE